MQDGEFEDDDVSPPVPAGLSELSGPLACLVEFLDIDPDFVSAASKWSAPPSDKSSDKEFIEWLLRLPQSEKDALLRRLAEGHETHLRAEMLSRFRKERLANERDSADELCHCPTVAELLREFKKIAEDRKDREARQRKIEEEEKARKAAADRKLHLKVLAARENRPWDELESLINSKQPAKYDAAVQLLIDLHELSVSQDAESAYTDRLQGIRARHQRKTGFLERLDKTDLPR